MKKNIFFLIALIAVCATLLIGCGGGGGGGSNPASTTKTGTLQGTVSIPTETLRASTDLASDSIKVENGSATKVINASVRAVQDFKGTNVWLEDFPDIKGVADKDGKYTLPNVPFGKHRVVAYLKIGDEHFKWRSDEQNVEKTEIVEVPQIVMQSANTSIAGTVYDAKTKEPIQGVIVEVWGQTSTSGADGKYTVYNMPAGSWDVSYTKEGYQSLSYPISFAEGMESAGNFYLVPVGTTDPAIASNSGLITLKELIPSYKAEQVSNQTTISAFFNGAMINTNYATISFSSGNPNNAKGKFSFENDYVIYTHSEEWPVNTKIAGEIGNLRDYFGNTIASFPFEFTTSANVVKSVIPANNSGNVEVDSPIEITFTTKINHNQNFVDLVKICIKDDNKSIISNNTQFDWATGTDNNDILKITGVTLETAKTYVIQLSDKILSEDGNGLQGQKEFTFDTRGAVYLTYEPEIVYHALSDIKFKINGGTISDVSKAKVILSCNNASGKLNIEGDYLVYKLDTGFQWPFGTRVAINISSLTDSKNAPIGDVSTTFDILAQCEIAQSDNLSDLRTSRKFNVSNGYNASLFDLSNARVSFLNANVQGKLSSDNNGLVYTLDNGQYWPADLTINGSITGVKDQYGLAVKECNFEFRTRANPTFNNCSFANVKSIKSSIQVSYNIQSFKNSTTLLDLSGARISFDSGSKSGKLVADGAKAYYELDSNVSWNHNEKVKGIITGVKDFEGVAIPDAEFNMMTRGESKIYMTSPFEKTDSWSEDTQRTYQMMTKQNYLTFATDYIDKIGDGKITFTNENIKGKLYMRNGELSYELNQNTSFPYPEKISGCLTGFKDVDGLDVPAFNFAIYACPFDGKGTESEPYLVSNAEQLYCVGYYNDLKNVGTKNTITYYHFKQTQDIDLSAYGSSYDGGQGWKPVKCWTGTYGNNINNKTSDACSGYYDGNGHKITNLYINRPGEYIGVFCGFLGEIKNLGVEVSSGGIKGKAGGALAANIGNTSGFVTGKRSFANNISNCWVTGGKITGLGKGETGGLFGGVSVLTLSNCYSTIDVEGTGKVGGLAGSASVQNMHHCYASGNVSAHNNSSVGGFIGFFDDDQYSAYDVELTGWKINSCFSKGNVTVDGNIDNNIQGDDGCCVGGFAGRVGYWGQIGIFNSYSTGNISILSSSIFVGGFVGITSDGHFINCYTTSNITATSNEGYDSINGYEKTNISGFIGYFDVGSLDNCYAGGNTINATNAKENRLVQHYNGNFDYSNYLTNNYASKNMTLTVDGVSKTPGSQIPLPETVALDREDGANLPDNVDWKTQIFKDNYENGDSFDSVWEIGLSGLPILRNMPGNPIQ